MRLYVVLAVAAMLAPALVSATTQEGQEGIAVTVLRIEGKGVYVTWSPGRVAIEYEVWRGASLDDLTLLARTPNLEYTDFAPLDEDAWYVIIGQEPTEMPWLEGPLRGKCLAVRGATGVALTLANCMPNRIP